VNSPSLFFSSLLGWIAVCLLAVDMKVGMEIEWWVRLLVDFFSCFVECFLEILYIFNIFFEKQLLFIIFVH
jgi:hypothetical protein